MSVPVHQRTNNKANSKENNFQEEQHPPCLGPRGTLRHCEVITANMPGNKGLMLCLYLRVEADLADVTGDDRSLGFDQRNSKSVVDHGLLHRVHLSGHDKDGDKDKKNQSVRGTF